MSTTRKHMTNHIIIWQKWVDPFGEDAELPVSSDDGIGDFLDEELSEELETEPSASIPDQTQKRSSVKVIAPPMGIIPMNENTASGKIFNFWIGHTNFSLTKNLVSAIEHTDGVETLDIFTRYRFRVAIGKAFIDSGVMRDINKNVYEILDYVK